TTLHADSMSRAGESTKVCMPRTATHCRITDGSGTARTSGQAASGDTPPVSRFLGISRPCR
ncbi:MAG: hypothetical protein ACKO2L_09710, partial [Planctomycetaceae bacterium]